MTLGIWLINLDGSDQRLARSAASLAAAGLPFARLPAFDGRKLTKAEFPLYDARATLARFGRDLTGGEIGCFLSHLDAARRFLDNGDTFGLVVEDDLSVPHDAAAVMAGLVQALHGGAARTPWHVANLGNPGRRMFNILGEVHPGYRLVRAHYFPVTTTAILWNREGAAAFVAAATRIDMPVDHWLRDWATKMDSGLALDRPLFPSVDLESEIDIAAPRKAFRVGLRFFWSKQKRLFMNKWRARSHEARFQRADKTT